MDVREQLRTAPPGPPPSDDDARRIFQRGRRRVVRRRAAGAGAALAVVLVAVVAVDQFGPPGSPTIEDEVAGPPEVEPGTDREPPGGEVVERQTVQIGQVVLTVPDGVTLERAGTGPEPCYTDIAEPTLVVMDTIVPDATDCPGGTPSEATVVAVPASGVPPMYLPGHADIEGTSEVTDTELLGTPGVVEQASLNDGTPVETYLFTELDLFLSVVAPAGTTDIVEELLASAAVATPEDDDAGAGEGSGEDTGGAPPLDDEASMEDREAPPAGPADLELIDVRVGTHDGFDRVVLEFSGEGQVGWFTNLGDDAIEDGSGAVVDVDGEAVLNVAVNMMAFPPDLPHSTVDWNGVRIAAPAGAGVLTEVVGSIWFEGQQQVFIGLDEAVAYRVVRFDDDPQLVAIDLIHP